MANQNQAEQIAQVKAAIAALEAQRVVLGDAVVETSLASLKKQLTELEGQAEQTEHQRKLLTILFTDVVGSTRISREFDPEDLLDFMDPALKRLARSVEQNGGRVTRFQGDGFKAIFGLPVARENDPEMAVRAGLGILEASQEVAQELLQRYGIENFQVRVGINTGLVASGGLTEGEDTIGGAAVNLAARLESAAPPGGLLISHGTYKHIRGVFNVVPAEPITAKGFPEPVPVYFVRGAKPRAFRVPSRGVEGVETRMVGRQTELKLLQDTLLVAIEDSEGQIVTVLGDAGVGKSRLLDEFQNWIELFPQAIRLYQGRSRPELQNLPYALLRDLFNSRFQIQEGDVLEIVWKKFEVGIGEAFNQASGSEANAHLIGQFLGIDFSASLHLAGLLGDPQALHNRALEALTDYFSAICRSGPVAVLLEDIHWADDSSLDVVSFLGRRIQDLPLIIVGLARPNLLERRPHWGEGQLNHRKIHLEALSKRESRQLVEEILQKIERVPAELQKLVVNGAEGNPFYIEELIKILVEEGVIIKDEPSWEVRADRLAQVDVPSTLTGVLQARLDSLPVEERTVLQQASVIGRVFWDRALEHLHSQQVGGEKDIRQTLFSLREKEMVFRREESAISQAYEYIFKHEILREVTYESVLKKLRRIYHGWVADWLIEQANEGGEEYSGLIADHLEFAGRSEQAREFLSKAGQAALESYANTEAVRYFRRALRLDPPLAERPSLLGGLSEALQRQGYRDESFEAWREGIGLYQGKGDLEGVARFYTAMIRSLLPDWPVEAVKQSDQALAAIKGMHNCSSLGHLLHNCAGAYFFHGQAERAKGLCRQALKIAEDFGDLELQADALALMAVLILDQPEEALLSLQRAVELAEANGYFYVAWKAHCNLGSLILAFHSDPHSALVHTRKSLEFARLRGSLAEELFSLENLVECHAYLGDIRGIEEQLHEFERIQKELPQPELIAGKNLIVRAKITWLNGEFEEAERLYSQVLAEARRERRVQHIAGKVLYDYLPLTLDIHRFLGKADWVITEDLLREVIDLADHSGGLIGFGEGEARMSTVYARKGCSKEARQWLERAVEHIHPDSPSLAGFFVTVAEIELAIAENRWEEAIYRLEAMIEQFRQEGRRWDHAHALLDLAEIYRLKGKTGDRERALDLFLRSKEIFAEIGASGYVDVIAKRLSILKS